ncbi:hypothetical protein E4634_00525 [Mangrovimicrobium sediminis]|uniref:Outer membrane protein beta-barrel domain-containing protein n=1 Tax=Mangrovimicrobium sediminis TaxID=2562682 RepID=A0A4Z0M976_9GAMM|nr:hypothetical protein [Haliea sp. SAOS-164]TGD76069.1 hypothetical protein E4634_00525 [Haliea sp. SAOS-164]
MTLSIRFFAVPLFTSCLAAFTAPLHAAPLPQPTPAWQFEVTPYAWAKSVEGESGGADIDLDFWDDLADILDAAAMVSGTARYNRWTLFTSYEFNRIKAGGRTAGEFDYTVPEDGSTIPVAADARVKIDQEQTYIDVGGAYDLAVYPTALWQVAAGVRWFDIDLKLKLRDITVITPDETFESEGAFRQIGDDWYTPFVGGRLLAQVGEKWRLRMRGDYGYADSDNGFWLLEALLDYRVADWGAVEFGYRHLDIDYANDSASKPYDYDVEESGPVLGFIFRF